VIIMEIIFKDGRRKKFRLTLPIKVYKERINEPFMTFARNVLLAAEELKRLGINTRNLVYVSKKYDVPMTAVLNAIKYNIKVPGVNI